ncbi:hypothetical protein BD413DRAFT_45620 [Trametes elegans]|nr:hypothetical protein BD413DRAFT_45620 [Trametes elegans]
MDACRLHEACVLSLTRSRPRSERAPTCAGSLPWHADCKRRAQPSIQLCVPVASADSGATACIAQVMHTTVRTEAVRRPPRATGPFSVGSIGARTYSAHALSHGLLCTSLRDRAKLGRWSGPARRSGSGLRARLIRGLLGKSGTAVGITVAC